MASSRQRPGAVHTDARPVVLVGTLLFALASLALLLFWTSLGAHHHRNWLWTALAGTALGLGGLLLIARHRRAGRMPRDRIPDDPNTRDVAHDPPDRPATTDRRAFGSPDRPARRQRSPLRSSPSS